MSCIRVETAGHDPAARPAKRVSAGATATCSPAFLRTAEVGYDGYDDPIGWGTPDSLTSFTG